MSTATKRPPAVVLGLGQNGLATVRALGRAGIPVIGIDEDCNQPTARTRYCQRMTCSGVRKGHSQLLQTLEDLGKTLAEPAVLFPSGDMSLTLASEHRARLARYYRFRLPDHETIQLVLDKVAFHRFGEAHGFPMPRTLPVTADLDVARAAKTLQFPCIVKPRQPNSAWRRHFPDQKALECAQPAELAGMVRRLRAIHPDLLIQEIIPGPDSRLEFSLTYLDGEGQPLGMFTGRKLRQCPPGLGTSCLAESYWNPEVAELTLNVLRALNYHGYGSIEFKRHPADGTLRLIEVTARTWFPHGLATACGVNLPLIAYRELIGLPVTPAFDFPDGVRWIHEERDLRVAWSAWRRGTLSLHDWWASYRGRRTYALTALDDPGPLLALGTSLVRRGARWAGHGFRRAQRGTGTTVHASTGYANRKDSV
jgi:predicted ATP-grasp superfamily ATP-dependent carboligase